MNRNNAPKKMAIPFGVNGIREGLKDSTASGENNASYELGFPAITMLPRVAGGKPPLGQDMNQILYELSALSRWASSGAINTYDAEFAKAVGGYPLGAVVLSDENGFIYISQSNDNLNDPRQNIVGWVEVGKLINIAALSWENDSFAYFTGERSAALSKITNLARSFLASGDAAGALEVLGIDWLTVDGQNLLERLEGDSYDKNGAEIIGTPFAIPLSEALKHSYQKNTIYVDNFYPGKSSRDDWSDIIESLLMLYPQGNYVFGQGIGITRPIKYDTYSSFSGYSSDRKTIVRKLPGFVGDSLFEPANKAKQASQNCSFSNLLLLDGEGAPDVETLPDGVVVGGRGTTSTINGIDITGTFNVKVDQVSGSHLRAIIYAGEGESGVHQTTQRATLTALDGNQCNYVVDMPGRTSENNYPYGDITINSLHCTGPVKYGLRILDVDGLQINGLLGFSSFQLCMNGTKLNCFDAHPFDPKARINDTGHSGETLLIPPRAGGGRTTEVQISGLSSDHAGRLADTTISNPSPVNEGAFGIKAVNVESLKLSADIYDPSMGGVHLSSCFDVIFDLNVRRVNTQNLGSGALPSGTYSTLVLEGCRNVMGRLNDRSPDRAYVLDSRLSTNVTIQANAGRGARLGDSWRVLDNPETHFLIMALEGQGGDSANFRYRQNGAPDYSPYVAATGSTAPSNCPSMNDILIVFNNPQDVSVTDIPSVRANQTVTVNIRDNGATKLRNTDNGGLFSGIPDYAKGRGAVYKFFRDPDTSHLVCIGGGV